MAWYEESFDEDYLLLYGRYAESRTRGEMKGLELLCPLQPGDRLLDLGCGTGRHAVPLAKQGYRVTGVDLSAAYLERARQRAEKTGVMVEFVQADMRRLAFHQQFEGAVSLFNSFGYFDDADDNRLVLERVRQALVPGGWFLLDVLDYECVTRNQHEGRTVQGGGFILHETSRVENGVNRIHQSIHKPGQPPRELDIALRLYRPQELASLLQECGFKLVGQWGDLEGGPPAQPSSTRLLTLARSDRV